MKLTLTRALVELKTLDDRINKAIAEATFVATAKGRNDKRTPFGTNATIGAVEARIVSSMQSVTDLMDRRNALKAALVVANATTTVTIASKQYTIAGAIEAKRMAPTKLNLLQRMKAQLAQAEHTVQLGNAKLSEDIDKQCLEAYKSDKNKLSPEMYDSIAKPRLDMSEMSLIDPLQVRGLLEVAEKAYAEFMAEVDVALSEANATTTIEV